jgi:hypothetical protein
MKKNVFFVPMLGMMLAFGLMVVGCVTQGNTKKGEVETSKTTNYPKLELIGNRWTDNGGGSEWTTERQIKLSDCVPNGAAEPGTQYIVTFAGTTDKTIDNFCIDWGAFDPWKSIANETWTKESVSGSFTYKGVITILPGIGESDFNRGYLRIKNSNNPAVSNRGDVETTLTNAQITIEDLAKDTMVLIGNSWTNNSGSRTEWTTERQIKLTDYVPNGVVKPDTSYIVTFAGTTDKPIDDFCIDWGAFDPWKSIANETWTKESVSGSFTYRRMIYTKTDFSESDSNRGYMRIKNSNNPAVSNRGAVEAILTNVRITIDENGKDKLGLRMENETHEWRGFVDLASYLPQKIEAGKHYKITVSGNLDVEVPRFQILIKGQDRSIGYWADISSYSEPEKRGPGSFTYEATLTGEGNIRATAGHLLMIRNEKPLGRLPEGDIPAIISDLKVTVVEVAK